MPVGAEGFEFHLGDRAFAGVFPTHGGEASVWVCTPADATTLGVGEGVDGFVDRLAGALTTIENPMRNGVDTATLFSPPATP